MLTKHSLQEIDKHVGQRLKEARKEAGLSLEKLAKKIGITYQQISKYESGANKISMSRMCQIAGVLDKPVFWFVPPEYGGEMAKHALALEGAINKLRGKEMQILEIISGA